MRRGCGLVVALVAAYASYRHQRDFALHGGADPTSAALWPLSVDGLLLLATVGLLRQRAGNGGRSRHALRAAFLLGIAVSLAANIAAAPALTWQSVLVAGWPPVSLLLAVELLVHGSGGGGRPSGRSLPSEGGGDDAPPMDPLLRRALEADARHRETYERPISAETLRQELRVGARTARNLVTQVRAKANGRRRTNGGVPADPGRP